MLGLAEISWPQLIALMSYGEDSRMAGVVHVREVREHDPDLSGQPADAHVPGVGPVKVREARHRVFKHGSLARRERLDGQPIAISGSQILWIWLGEAEIPTAFPKNTTVWSFDDSAAVERPALVRWEGNDFTRPSGPIRSTEFLGRAAWSVELAPPAHKPFPLTIIVDAETGVVLQQRNDGFGSVTQWAEVSFGAQFPDDLFVWTGETVAPPDRFAEHRRRMAVRRAWLDAQGIRQISMRVEAGLVLHRFDDNTGEFEARLDFEAPSGAVLRRRRSGEPWETHSPWPHEVRWSDGEWDWYVGSGEELSAKQIADLRAGLGSRGAGDVRPDDADDAR